MSGASVALNLPRPARVRAGRGGVPVEVDGQSIELVRESWLVEDRWWTAQPLRRRYWEAVSASGRNVVVFHEALSDPERIGLALSVRLGLLPGPAAALGLTVERFGPPAGEQRALLRESRVARAARLREAVGQVRAAAGADAALRAICVDPDSRVPERRVVLAPLPG